MEVRGLCDDGEGRMYVLSFFLFVWGAAWLVFASVFILVHVFSSSCIYVQRHRGLTRLAVFFYEWVGIHDRMGLCRLK